MTACHPCRGTGRAGGWDNMPGIVVPDCPRCLGAGRVDSRGLAHALEAWRWLRERSREREALAALRFEMSRPHWGDALGRVFVDVAMVLDTLDEASGLDGSKWTAGHAFWTARRWGKATGDMVAGAYGAGIKQMQATWRQRQTHGDEFPHGKPAGTVALTWRQRRTQRAFWLDVCPGVVDFLVAVDDPAQLTMRGVA